MRVDKLHSNIRNSKLNPPQQREQLGLLAKLNQLQLKRRQGDAGLDGQIHAMETAFQMQSEAMQTLDITREPESLRVPVFLRVGRPSHPFPSPPFTFSL